MGYGEYLKGLLRPLWIYQTENTINGYELEAYGSQMDVSSNQLDEIAREMDLTTAETWGLEKYRALLPFSLTASSPEELRRGVIALTETRRCTLPALTQALADCGLSVQLRETGEPLTVEILYENPDRLETLKQAAEALLPCQLAVRYTLKTDA